MLHPNKMIELLSEHVANQIAAGEVIQRPASAVKELLENAIDAQSTKIQLIVKDAGASLVQVIDNGMGMTKEDAEICFRKHATSKIKNTEDLFSISSKGLFNFHLQLFLIVPGVFSLQELFNDNRSCIGTINKLALVFMPISIKFQEGLSEYL